ncbi:MAG: SH3 domain-containing protein [Bacteroidales bacterium]|nr:SH3 domain-containing protein [Bacteroidales bacterium]
MKFIFSCISILMFTLGANYLFANEGIVYPATFKTTNALNVRQHPNQTSEKVGLLQKSEEVVVDSMHDNQWACITHNGEVAYIATDFIAYQHSVPKNKNFVETLKNVRIVGRIPITGAAGIAIILVSLFVGICFLYFLSSECRTMYVIIAVVGGIGYFIGGFTWFLWAIAIALGFFFFVFLSDRRLAFYWTLLKEPLFALNQLQYILQKPWRPLLKNRDSRFCKLLKMSPKITPSMHPMQRFCYKLWHIGHYVIAFVFFLLQFALYIISTPLRLFNAFFYNIIIHIPCALHDYIAEVFNPKGDGMRFLGKWEYWYQYFLKLPYRFYKYLLKRSILTTLESIIYTIVDIVVPTLTMYHGTSNDASYQITGDEDVTFKVGGGNYAGNGIYFAIAKSTSEHYARGAIIIARVSLGRVFNINTSTDDIRNCVACRGEEITKWGLRKKITTIEWWRKNTRWWEYCMLQQSGIYKKAWRIRPLYIENVNTGSKERIYKGMAPWIFKKMKNSINCKKS